MTLGTGEVFAGYTIVRMLGSGGMGEVYLAQHPRVPRQEALKLLRPKISTDTTARPHGYRSSTGTFKRSPLWISRQRCPAALQRTAALGNWWPHQEP